MIVRLTLTPKLHNAMQVGVHWRDTTEPWHGAGNLHLPGQFARSLVKALHAGLPLVGCRCEILDVPSRQRVKAL